MPVIGIMGFMVRNSASTSHSLQVNTQLLEGHCNIHIHIQVFGRSKEVERVIQVLARRSKNNPILLGEPGVGKTAIAEGLAHCIVKGSSPGGNPLPGFLVGKKILQLDVGLLIAGAKERGELERRVTSMLAELQNRKDIILM